MQQKFVADDETKVLNLTTEEAEDKDRRRV